MTCHIAYMVLDDIGDDERYVEDIEDAQKVFGLSAEDQYDHSFQGSPRMGLLRR